MLSCFFGRQRFCIELYNVARVQRSNELFFCYQMECDVDYCIATVYNMQRKKIKTDIKSQ